jgi:hypothetical protein
VPNSRDIAIERLNDELQVVLSEIVAVLDLHGQADKARWLASRLAMLREPTATSDQRTRVRAELHSVVLGMGGLVDLRLEPDPTSRLSVVDARKLLLPLADRLYELTRGAASSLVGQSGSGGSGAPG